jgi:thiamine monophosphate synthase
VLGPAAVRAGVPVLAIGGVTPDRAREALEAGAHGVAVISGVWARPDPVAAAEYLEAMGVRR